jgi:hypothetical protein
MEDEVIQPDMAALMEQLNGLGSTLEGLNAQIEELKSQKVEAPVEPIEPVNDPDMAPPPTWKDLRTEIRTEAERIADEKYLSKIEEEKQLIEVQKTAEKEWDDKFEKEAAQAVEQGFLPPVVNEKDHNDPGNAARRDLFGFAHFMGQEDLLKVADIVKTYNNQGKHFDVDQGKWIQSEYRALGKNIPVGSSANRVSSTGQTMNYKELHGTSMDQLARKAKAKYGIE